MYTKDRLLKKEYMGVWRKESTLIKAKKGQVPGQCCNVKCEEYNSVVIWGTSENPKRMNWVIVVIFLPPIITSVLLFLKLERTMCCRFK